ncbi:MAG: PIN domain-containing protein [Acidobacteria bacterium]|nr:PIN domain-containing protein [Acidobacteriota bacterium]
MKLRDLLRKLKGERLGFDSSFFLYHLESNSRFEPVTSAILHAVESGTARALASILVFHDLFLRLSRSNPDATATFEALLRNFPNLKFVAIDEAIVTDAARLEVEHAVSAWTALHLACVRSGGANFFFTADRGLPALPEIKPIVLDSIQP